MSVSLYTIAMTTVSKTLDVDGSTLASNDYQVQLSVPEGSYRLVVWNGLSDTKNYSEENAAVTLKNGV